METDKHIYYSLKCEFEKELDRELKGDEKQFLEWLSWKYLKEQQMSK